MIWGLFQTFLIMYLNKKMSDDRHCRCSEGRQMHTADADTIKEQMIINIGISKHYSTMWRNGFFVKSAIILQQCRSSYCASLPMAITPHNDSISLFIEMFSLK